jgi:putative DNA primase/helicase
MDNRYETSSLIDKRLVWIDEITIKEFNMVSENRLKTMISGGTVVIEMKYKGQFSYRPQAKWVITGNELPRINDASDGFWRRIMLIPFKNVIDNPDKEFVEKKIIPELPGIFNWALDGLNSLRKHGFIEPEASKEAKDEWKEDSDPLRVFISDSLNITGIEKDRIDNDVIYDKYSSWCTKSGNKPLSSNHFSRRIASLLENRSVFRKKNNSRRFFTGILLKTPYED